MTYRDIIRRESRAYASQIGFVSADTVKAAAQYSAFTERLLSENPADYSPRHMRLLNALESAHAKYERLWLRDVKRQTARRP